MLKITIEKKYLVKNELLTWKFENLMKFRNFDLWNLIFSYL